MYNECNLYYLKKLQKYTLLQQNTYKNISKSKGQSMNTLCVLMFKYLLKLFKEKRNTYGKNWSPQ